MSSNAVDTTGEQTRRDIRDAAVLARLGAAVQYFRLNKRPPMTQAELARRAGINQGYVSHIENGRRSQVSWTVLVALAQALEITPAQLIETATHRGAVPVPGRAHSPRGRQVRELFSYDRLDTDYFLNVGAKLLSLEHRDEVARLIKRLLAEQVQAATATPAAPSKRQAADD